MRVVNFLLAVMFLLFAFLQVNDPDPLIWILIYGTMAVLAVMAIFEYHPKRFLIGLIILLAGYSAVYFRGVLEWLKQEDKSGLFDEVAKMEHWYIEEAREFLGLLICIVVVAFYYFRSRKGVKATA
ncbi:MAG: transmembrane 220 family protein [Chryseolinea sp.]